MKLYELIKIKKDDILKLYVLIQQYEITVKSYYLKTGLYKDALNIRYNRNIKKLLKYIINRSEYPFDWYNYDIEYFNNVYKRVIQHINLQIKMFNELLERKIEQYQ